MNKSQPKNIITQSQNMHFMIKTYYDYILII
jgi:hypothetical protein